ncbi:MAG TPA: hypothetical protein PLS84_03230 [Salinivirgaceae bacterium]|nr:hypothetical protein [Salinivirgaceae bacterium]
MKKHENKEIFIDISEAEEFLQSKNIYNHPFVYDSVTEKNSYEVAHLLAEFATMCVNSYIEKQL